MHSASACEIFVTLAVLVDSISTAHGSSCIHAREFVAIYAFGIGSARVSLAGDAHENSRDGIGLELA